MFTRRNNSSMGQRWGVWPVLLVLLTAVLVPTACVLWFMGQAVGNERLAVRQRLIDAYRGKLREAQGRADAYWRPRLEAINQAAAEAAQVSQPAGGQNVKAAPAQLFEHLVREKIAASVIVYDSSGKAAYPSDATAGDEPLNTQPHWQAAQELEWPQGQVAAAADAYAKIASEAAAPQIAANALVAQARCLAKCGRQAEAMEILTGKLAEPAFRAAKDMQGRLIYPNALLAAVQLSGPGGNRRASSLRSSTRPTGNSTPTGSAAQSLHRQVTDYSDTLLPSAQRLFLMSELRRLWPECPLLPTLAAEGIAAEYLASRPSALNAGETPATRETDNWFIVRSANGAIVAIYDYPQVQAEMATMAQYGTPPTEAQIALIPPGPPPEDLKPAFLRAPAEGVLEGWEFAVLLVGEDPFAAASQKQVLAYFWTGGLGIVAIAAIALLLAAYMRRQVHLARLKNDLVATVSHELKTPLASMRVLIDTLADGRANDPQQVREYYELIARENHRLSRLIDNFLTFSRMERNKKPFERQAVDVRQVVREAVDAVKDRFTPPQVLDVDIAPDLPAVLGDRDALVTVIVNLLDNAYKYSGSEKRVTVRAFALPAAQRGAAVPRAGRHGQTAVQAGYANATEQTQPKAPNSGNGVARPDGGLAIAPRQVCIQVSDNGIGMGRRAMRRIFDRFYQVDQTLTRKAGGCGLGLSIVKYMVDAHGGEVDVESQPGKGSSFTVRLRAMEAAGA